MLAFPTLVITPGCGEIFKVAGWNNYHYADKVKADDEHNAKYEAEKKAQATYDKEHPNYTNQFGITRKRPSTNVELTCVGYEYGLGNYLIRDGQKNPAWYENMLVSKYDDPNLQIFGNKVIQEIGKNPTGVAQYIRSGNLYNDCVKAGAK